MGRIVVNFEPGGKPPEKRHKARRWPRFLAVLAVFVIAIIALAAVGGFFWWRPYQSTPVYSLALVLDAAQRSDTQELARRIDDEEVARNMVVNVSQKAGGRYGLVTSAATQQQINKLMPSLLPRLQQTIHDEVATEIRSFASTGEPKSFIFLLLTVPSLVKITTEGDIANVTAAMNNRNVELTMRRDADRWKVIGFNDDVVVQRVVDRVMKELIDAFGYGDPILKIPEKPRKKRR